MKQTLKQVTRFSDRGCIDEYVEIDRIVTRLADIPVSAFRNDCGKIILHCLSEFMEDNGMNPERSDEVTYAEALAMIDGIVTSGTYECNGIEWCRDRRFSLLARFESMLLKARNDNTALRLFMAVTVRAYLGYLACLMGIAGNRFIAMYESFSHDIEENLDFKITDRTTIKELLLMLDGFMHRGWIPGVPITEFESGIRKSYDSLYILLIEHFRGAFCKKTNLQSLKEKYPKEEE